MGGVDKLSVVLPVTQRDLMVAAVLATGTFENILDNVPLFYNANLSLNRYCGTTDQQ